MRTTAGTDRPPQRWTEAEEALLVKAVDTMGTGKWALLVKEFDFGSRAAHMVKDKWRRMEARRPRDKEE